MTPKAFILATVCCTLLGKGHGQACGTLFPSGLPGRVFQVLSGSDLNYGINRARSSDILQLNVINGTHWLHLGGKLTSFEAVVGQPPATSSDLTLDLALDQLNKTSGAPKAMIKFHPSSLSIASNLDNFAKSMPIWRVLSPDDMKGGSNGLSSNLLVAMEWPRKTYGLDEVFSRVHSENLLLEFDFNRIKAILDEAFAAHVVPDNDLVYLTRKYKSIKREAPTSFTELFLNNLLHLAEHLKDMDELVFLPDLQKTATTCTRKELDDVHDVFKATEEEGAKCGLLLVRAGIFMKSECLDALSSYLATNINVKLIIFSLPSDFLPLNEFVTALNSFGKENVILDLPKVVLQKVQNLAGNAAFEADFDANDDGHSGAVQMSSNPIVRLLFMALLNYAK